MVLFRTTLLLLHHRKNLQSINVFVLNKFLFFILMCVDPSTNGKLNDSSGGEVKQQLLVFLYWLIVLLMSTISSPLMTS